MTVDNSETQDIVESVATENIDADSQEHEEGQEQQPEQEQEVEQAEAQKQEEAQKTEKKNRAQKRIQELNARALEAERKLAEYESKAKTSEIKRPALEDFEDFREYEEALEQYHIDKAEERVLAKLDERESSKSKQAKEAEFHSAITETAAQFSDFNSVVEAGIARNYPMPISIDELAIEFGYDAKTQARLLYEIAKDEKFHDEVSSSSKLKAARLLSEKVDSFSQSKTPPPVSKAPKPLKPVQANAPASRSIDSLSDEEFLAQRRRNRLKG